MKRYHRNKGVVNSEEQKILKEKSVCLVGCGGLGGGIMENLVRLGIGRLTVVDGDVFDETNLNRQVLSNEGNLGKSKALQGAEQMALINSQAEVTPLQLRINAENCRDIIRGHDVVIDALDNVQSRLILEDACDAENLALVHGAISGWNGQVAVALPGSRLLHKIYGEAMEAGTMGNPSFTPAVIGGIQASETLKLLLGQDSVLKNKLLMLDLLEHEYEIIDFS